MTIDAEYATPAAEPLYITLDNALAPYLSGDLDATGGLIKVLTEIIASADHTPDLVRTLHTAIKGLTPTAELMPAIYKAVGVALELNAPAEATSTYNTAHTSQPTATRRGKGPREGTDGDTILKIMAEKPGVPMKIGHFTKLMGGASRAGAIGAAMNRLVSIGLTIEVTAPDDPAKHYLRTDDPTAPQQAPDTTDEAESAPVTAAAPEAAPAADTAPDTDADTAKATPARRGTAKTGK